MEYVFAQVHTRAEAKGGRVLHYNARTNVFF